MTMTNEGETKGGYRILHCSRGGSEGSPYDHFQKQDRRHYSLSKGGR
jgi:hypothetical protein